MSPTMTKRIGERGRKVVIHYQHFKFFIKSLILIVKVALYSSITAASSFALVIEGFNALPFDKSKHKVMIAHSFPQ